MALPKVPEERDQGAVQADEQLAAGAPAPLEPTPAQADEALVPNLGTAIPNVGTVSQTGNAPQPGNPTNMWRIPTNYAGVLGQQTPNPVQQRENVGRLWQALAANPSVSPMVRLIAESLVGGGPKRGAV